MTTRLIDGPATAPATLLLAPAIRLAWIPEADHSLRPTRRSGLDEAAALALAVAHADGFLRELLADPYAPSSAEGP